MLVSVRTIIFWCAWVFFTGASLNGEVVREDAPEPDLNIEAPYQLSKTGLETVKENILTVKNSISQTEANIAICKNNVAILKGEISELNQFEVEHEGLQQKYEKYVQTAKNLKIKNKEILGRLESWKTKMEAEKSSNPKAERSIATAETERETRLEWAKDADIKISTITRLKESSQKDQGIIRIRKTESSREKEVWERRNIEFVKNLSALKDKLVQYETILAKQLQR